MRLRARWKKQMPCSLAEIRWVTAKLGRAQPALGTDLRPNLRIRLHVEVRQAAVGGGFGPFVNPLQLLGFGGGEEVAGLLHGLVEAAGAEVIGPALEHGEAELHRQDLLEHGQVLLRELLLQVDGVRGDDRLLLVAPRHTGSPAPGRPGSCRRRCRPRPPGARRSPRPAPRPPPFPAAAGGTRSSSSGRECPWGRRSRRPAGPGPWPEPAGWDSMALIMEDEEQAGRRSYLGRRTTTSWGAWFFTIMLAGRMPRQLVFGINHRAAPDDAAGVQHGVAADVGVIAQQRAELAQAGVERAGRRSPP